MYSQTAKLMMTTRKQIRRFVSFIVLVSIGVGACFRASPKSFLYSVFFRVLLRIAILQQRHRALLCVFTWLSRLLGLAYARPHLIALRSHARFAGRIKTIAHRITRKKCHDRISDRLSTEMIFLSGSLFLFYPVVNRVMRGIFFLTG